MRFYRQLLRCRRPEVVIVLLFLAAIVMFQLAAPMVFNRQDDDDVISRQHQTVTLSHQEAMWEVLILQEQVKKLEAQISSLKQEVSVLSQEPAKIEEPFNKDGADSLWEFIDTIPYHSMDKNGLYAASDLFDRNVGSLTGGFRGAIIEETNAIGSFVSQQYNLNPKGSIFHELLRGKSEPGNLTLHHFQTGIHRYIPKVGMEYQLFFRDPSTEDINDHYLYKVSIDRRFEKVPKYGVQHINVMEKSINIVVPLIGRLDTFKRFMLHLVHLKASTDFKLYLTVTYFGEEGLQEIRQILDKARKQGFQNVDLITLKAEKFSRGLGRQKGVESWHRGNDIMFFCDVDVIIDKHFLERCLIYANKSQTVYYPIVFSQYNPDVVSFFYNKTSRNTSRLSSQEGYWRKHGYGMLCVHKADFFKVGGYQQWRYDQVDKTWGDEDVDLYKKFVEHPRLSVIRAPDPGIAHTWHPKACPKNLASDRLRQCLSTMVITEGSYEQLGQLHIPYIYDDFRALNKSLSFKKPGR